MKTNQIIMLVLRLVAVVIMAQTLYFKFTGQPESIYIFKTVGIEPYGRIGTGIAELIACILLLMPKTIWFGALMGVGIMAGAIATHLFLLGIVVMNDGGELFILALITFVCCSVLLWFQKDKVIAFTQNVIR